MTGTIVSNRISLKIKPEDLTAIEAAIQTLLTIYLPYLRGLTPRERKALPKMGAKTVDFVTQTLEQTSANVEIKPGFIDLDEYRCDLDAVTTLRVLLQPLQKLATMTEDSMLLAGSEAYDAALACYKAFQEAAKRGVPGAAEIVAILAPRFQGQRATRTANARRGSKQVQAAKEGSQEA